MPDVFIGGRQSGKTTMLIKRSAITGETIAVATHKMAEYVKIEAYRLGLDIPQPVTYAEYSKIIMSIRKRISIWWTSFR